MRSNRAQAGLRKSAQPLSSTLGSFDTQFTAMKHPDTEPARERYRGMAVNERLMVAYLMDQFDSAARRRDRAAMMALLTQVDLDRGAGRVDD